MPQTKEQRKIYRDTHKEQIKESNRKYHQDEYIRATRKLKTAIECELLYGISEGTIRRKKEAQEVLDNLIIIQSQLF